MSETQKANIGMLGLAVMGRNLALNIADHGFRVAVWNRDGSVTDRLIAENAKTGHASLVPTKSIQELVASLERPRRVWVMVKAGKPVDDVIDQLKPLLEKGDVIIDGGNTHFQETRRREADLAALGLNFVGTGVSRAAKRGRAAAPRIMPGGEAAAWESLRPILEAISAKTDSGPCVTHCGPDGAGPLRQDGPQRDRIRRHAAHRRGLRPDVAGPGADRLPRWARSSPAGTRGRWPRSSSS